MVIYGHFEINLPCKSPWNIPERYCILSKIAKTLESTKLPIFIGESMKICISLPCWILVSCYQHENKESDICDNR
jgi:hypothetical protein